jgi:hypothetical protein
MKEVETHNGLFYSCCQKMATVLDSDVEYVPKNCINRDAMPESEGDTEVENVESANSDVESSVDIAEDTETVRFTLEGYMHAGN